VPFWILALIIGYLHPYGAGPSVWRCNKSSVSARYASIIKADSHVGFLPTRIVTTSSAEEYEGANGGGAELGISPLEPNLLNPLASFLYSKNNPMTTARVKISRRLPYHRMPASIVELSMRDSDHRGSGSRNDFAGRAHPSHCFSGFKLRSYRMAHFHCCRAPHCSQVVAGVAGFASAGRSMAEDAFSLWILGTLPRLASSPGVSSTRCAFGSASVPDSLARFASSTKIFRCAPRRLVSSFRFAPLSVSELAPPFRPYLIHCGKSETFQRFQSPKEPKVLRSSSTESLNYAHLAESQSLICAHVADSFARSASLH
jgi:hypothetical protein